MCDSDSDFRGVELCLCSSILSIHHGIGIPDRVLLVCPTRRRRRSDGRGEREEGEVEDEEDHHGQAQDVAQRTVDRVSVMRPHPAKWCKLEARDERVESPKAKDKE